MSEPTIIRASALTRYPDCGRRSAAQLFRREIEADGHRLRRMPHGIAATIGSAVHKAAEFVLAGKMHTGSPPPSGDATDVSRDHLVQALGDGETAVDQISPQRSDALRQVISLTRLYHAKVAPMIFPQAVERRLEADAGGGIILSGHADVIAVEPGQIDDLKTGGAKEPGNFNAQIGSYSLLAKSALIEVKQGAIDYLRRVPVSKPTPDPIRVAVPLAIAEQTAINVLRHIADDLRVWREGDERLGLKPGDPAAFLANPSSVLCSEKYCRAHGTSFCREWQKSE